MAIFIFLLGFLLFFGSDSYAQVYKYVNRQGAICFTDSPPASLFKDRSNKEETPITEAPKEIITERRRTEIKDIIQMGQEILEEELAKPLAKQNRRLIQEMKEILYGDVAGKRSK